MARLALAGVLSCALVTALATPALAQEKEVPRVGSLVVPGASGQLLALMIRAFHRPPTPLAPRMQGWVAPPPELPRPTVATVWKIAF
jgi:hypothetical protein